MRASLLLAGFALQGALAAQAGPDDHDRGRALFTDLGCVHCHAEATPGALTRQSPTGPDLREAGKRLAPAWLERWITAPRGVHANARMPSLADAAAARDLATWLGSLGGALGALDNPWRDGDGDAVFLRRGCVACHSTDERGDGRWSLHELAQKTTPRALVDRIEHPFALAPRGAMPDLGLSRGEAEQLAGFLCAEPKHGTFTPGNAKRGKEHFVELRCGACHAAPEDAKARPAPALATLVGKRDGCLAEAPLAGLPRWGFTAEERAGLRAFLADPTRAETKDRELARRTEALGCVRCHGFATGGGMPPAILQDVRDAIAADTTEGSDPPDLVKAKERLRVGYVRDVLERGTRARPYLALRMPSFPRDQVAGLADLLCKPRSDVTRPAPLARVEAGKTLVGTGGLSCITCHDFAGQPSLGQRGPDLTQMHARLEPEFLERWIRDPAAIRPGTRMPSFFPGGKSAITNVLDGDAAAQVDALLAYLALGPRMTPPAGLKPPGETVIVPSAHPIVLRTEFPETKVRTLGIGFPGGLSFAFETSGPTLAYVWEGGFVDMKRKWSGRGDGPCDLVGGKVYVGGTPLWSEPKLAFSGYELLAEAVEVVYGRGTPDEVRLRWSPRTGVQGRGLVLRVTTKRTNGFAARLGTLERAFPDLQRANDLALAVLAAPRECAVCVTGHELAVKGDALTLEVGASGTAETTFWFVASANEAVRRALLEER